MRRRIDLRKPASVAAMLAATLVACELPHSSLSEELTYTASGSGSADAGTQVADANGGDSSTTVTTPTNVATNDSDGDGVSDASDSCVYVYNPGQTDGDFDGVGDQCDSDDDDDGIVDVADNCTGTWNAEQTDTDGDGRGDACDWTCMVEVATALGTTEFQACAPPTPPKCDETKMEFTASMSLSSAAHHAPQDKHVRIPTFGADYIETCPDGDCRGNFRHARSATVRWRAWCHEDANGTCIAKVDTPQPLLKGQPVNVGGAWDHWHNGLRGHSCAFVNNGDGIEGTTHCSINGAETVKLESPMTQWGDGVVYGMAYAANHSNDNQPSVGVSVGYKGAGAFVIINNPVNATFTKGQAFAQGMACDANGKPYKLANDGNGHDFPQASSAEGNEQ